jgi:hypothetical protein
MLGLRRYHGIVEHRLGPHLQVDCRPRSTFAHPKDDFNSQIETSSLWRDWPFMAESFGNSFTIVEVTADDLSADGPTKQFWIAFAQPSQALTLVLAAVPEGWDGGTRGSTPDARAAKAF